ncbi:MAG: hypothetical protein ACQESX_04380 [Bacteroidota bacterium]
MFCKTYIKAILLLLPFFIGWHSSMGQERISLQLRVPPGNEINLDEAFSIVLINSGQNTEVYLRATVDEAENGSLFEGVSSKFLLSEGSSYFNRRNYTPLQPIETRFSDLSYKDYAQRTSKFPPGSYKICVAVYSVDDNSLLAEECYEKVVEEFLPPSLISPENRSIVSQSNPFFTWSPVPGSQGSNITYSLVIAEIIGNQSPVAALENNPPFYKASDISSPIFQYPVQARGFDLKGAYAWKVEAFQGSEIIAESEAWAFRYYKDDDEDEDESDDEDDTEEEDVLIPDQYFLLKKQFVSGYHLLKGYTLRVSYQNSYGNHDLQCKLTDPNKNIISENILTRTQLPGLNFHELNLQNLIKPGQKYHLNCHDPLGNEMQLKFISQEEIED